MRDRHAPFPTDWTEWRELWQGWKAEHADALRPTSYRFPPPNFLADEVLGAWRTPAGIAELSEVTFPELGKRNPRQRVRYVGLTFASSGTRDTGLASNFAELEELLGIINTEEVSE